MCYERILQMICTKCNNEIPDGAKFCPSCGASAMTAPESEKKFYCEKCGLELMPGAKFCSVCGGSGVARDVQPAAASESAEKNMAAVDLNKPSQSDSLVSAMNSAGAVPTPASNGIPMPTASVPTSVNGVPTPSNGVSSAPVYGTGDPVIPAYVASVSNTAAQAPVMAMPNASGAAAVTKKKNGGKIAVISVLGVLLVAIAVGAIMFFTNRAAMLSTFMGKAKYATMVEGTSIKNATDKLDITAISNGIKSASGTYQTIATVSGGDMSIVGVGSMNKGYHSSVTSDTVSSNKTARLISASGSGVPEIDLSEISEELSKMLMDIYGVNSVSESLNVNIELNDSMKSMLLDELYYSDINKSDLDSLIDLLNGTTLNYSVASSGNKSAVTVGTQGKLTVNAKVLLDGQNVYIALPFASEKAIMLTLKAPAESDKFEVKPLELDEKEIERLITECVEIYLDYYKASAIEMENGNIKAAGVTVEGKLITAEFKGKQLSELFTDIAKHIVNDDYLMTRIADYAKNFDDEITKQKIVDSLLKEIDNTMEANDSDKLVIMTVIDRNGNVLGKTIKAVSGTDTVFEFSYAETNEKCGFEVKVPDEGFSLEATAEKKSDESGIIAVKVTDGDETGSFVIDYSDVKKAEFCGNEIYTGKFSAGMALPESFSDQLGKEGLAAVNGAKLTFELAADSKSTLEYSVELNVPGYIKVALKDVVTAVNDDSELKTPANVIDITSMVTGGMPDAATMTALTEFGSEAMEALEKALPEFLQSGFDLPISFDPGSSFPGSSGIKSDLDELISDIKSDMEDIQMALRGMLTYDRTLTTSTELEAILSDYTKLYLEIMAKGSDMTAEEFEAFEERYWDLWIDLPYFSDELGTMPGFNDPRLNEISDRFIADYIQALNIGEYMEKLSGNAEAEKLYGDLEKAVNDLMSFCESTGAYDWDGYTDAQLAEADRLLGIIENKISAFMAKYNFQ